MADGRQRTAEEREAARREREARRATREGLDEPAFEQPLDQPESEPGPEPQTVERPADPGPGPVSEPESDPPAAEPPARPIKSFPSSPDPDFYADEDELQEVPSGTRRVSRASRLGAVRPRAAPRPRPRTGGKRKPPRRGPRPVTGGHRRHPWRFRIIALFFLLVAAAIVWFLIELFQPFGTSPHGRRTVRIAPMTSSSTVGKQLQADGVISSSFFFELRATLAGDRDKIRAGTYHLREGMSYGAVLSKLTAVPKAAKTSKLTIADGHDRHAVSALLRGQKVRGSYLAATRHSKLLNPRVYGAPKRTDTLEGFLFPDTFTLVDPPKVSALVADQLKDFKRHFATVNLSWAKAHHFTPFQVLTIASLIEGEAGGRHDRPQIASVIYNRLRDHMMLQLDSTTRFATGNVSKPLTESQLNSRSPYNTRTHVGLPPGPINSPGMAAIQAAAHPASTDYRYFFTKPCSRQTVFATDYVQFQNLLIRDHRNHCP